MSFHCEKVGDRKNKADRRAGLDEKWGRRVRNEKHGGEH